MCRWGRAPLVVGAFFAVAAPLTAYATPGVTPRCPRRCAWCWDWPPPPGRWGRRGRAVLLLAVIALPWLSVKYAPVAAVLVVALAARTWRRDRRQLALDLAVLAAAGNYLPGLSIAACTAAGPPTPAATTSWTASCWVMGRDPELRGPQPRGWWDCWWTAASGWSPGPPPTCWPCPPWLLLARWRPRGWSVLLGTFAASYAVATWMAFTMHGWWWPGRQLVVALTRGGWWPSPCSPTGSPRCCGAALTGCAVGLFNWLWLVVEVLDGAKDPGHRLRADRQPCLPGLEGAASGPPQLRRRRR